MAVSVLAEEWGTAVNEDCTCKCAHHMGKIENLKAENAEIRGERKFYEAEVTRLKGELIETDKYAKEQYRCYEEMKKDLNIAMKELADWKSQAEGLAKALERTKKLTMGPSMELQDSIMIDVLKALSAFESSKQAGAK